MDNCVNYRYRDFQNRSFQSEFSKSAANHADFTGARLSGCDFQGAGLAGADFSGTAIACDQKNFQNQRIHMVLHIILGGSLGIASFFAGQLVFGGRGGSEIASPYGWTQNPFVWIFAFATAAAISHRRLLFIYMGLIGLMVIAAINSTTLTVVGIGVMIVAFGMSLFGLYLGYKKGAIAVGMVWMSVGISSAISAGYSWIKYQEIHYVILFTVLTIGTAVLATRAFNLHWTKVKMLAMTSFDGADLANARFVNAVLENCDFSGANLAGTDWRGAIFKNCKFPKGFSPN
jgi:hypothetical protein